MRVRYLILLLCFSPTILFAKQEEQFLEHDLELFEFLAMYEKKDEVFIDAEMDDKIETKNLTNQQVNMSESNE